MGISSRDGWASRRAAVSAALASFRPVDDARVLGVRPWRLEVVTLPSDMPLRTFHQRYPSPVGVEETARINRVDVDASLPRGTRLKRVVGDPLP